MSVHASIACELQCVRAAASTDDEAIKSMQDFQKGLQQRLQDHVQELKTGKSNAAPAGGSSTSCFISSLHISIGLQDGMYTVFGRHMLGGCLHITSPCAFMVPGFRVAAAAVEAEAGPDLRELSVDDWDSALAEAGDTLVVVDFYTNW